MLDLFSNKDSMNKAKHFERDALSYQQRDLALERRQRRIFPNGLLPRETPFDFKRRRQRLRRSGGHYLIFADAVASTSTSTSASASASLHVTAKLNTNNLEQIYVEK